MVEYGTYSIRVKFGLELYPDKTRRIEFGRFAEENRKEQKIPIASYSAVRETVPFISLFEDAIQVMEKQLPAQTKLKIGTDPVVCVTPLLGAGDGNMRPLTTNIERLS